MFTDYKHLGCWKDKKARAVHQLEGSDARLKGSYRNRKDAINKCYIVARERGMKVFALQNGGWCAGSKDLNGYKKYGRSKICKKWKGGPWTNDVYQILKPKGGKINIL